MKPATRRKARLLALQAIYQWQFNALPAAELIAQFLEVCNPKKVDTEYFSEIVSGTISNIEKIDRELTPQLDRKLKEVNPVELAILRTATYELIAQPDIPYKVIINEALEVCKIFGAEESFKFINGVLDKIAKLLR